ncbi:GNAT family N-acetyltransferase [Spongiibacter sp. KMU-158]|uniref:GNAT family N-acetyltransferase n=1 Tax=Spongiibacter pelagi TaxID=2760804 RepID=A0A927C1N8_9GAMM|nr:GNAT family N-acetyltransferase [Spongiibacter pelagi]MBD2858397.1 GNAT family N-acetyltransferase [Spongiibacter pelagi]
MAQAVPLIYSSGESAFRYVFSSRSALQVLGFLNAAFKRGRTEWGYQQHIGLFIEGELAGIGALKTSNQTLGFTVQAAVEIFRFYGFWQGILVVWRGLRTETVIRPPKKELALLYHLAMKLEYRGRGYGRQLIGELIWRARQQGFTRLGLDVAENNPRARALYEGLGFRSIEFRSGGLRSAYGEVVGHSYMELDLTAAPNRA